MSFREPSFSRVFASFDLSESITVAIAAAVLYVLTQAIYDLYFSSLASIPGPFLAKVSRYWLLYYTLNRRRTFVTHELHKKYGPAVRIEPDQVAFLHQPSIKVYDKFNKGAFYKCLGNNGSEIQIVTLDSADHAAKRIIKNAAYNVPNVNAYQEEGRDIAKYLVMRIEKATLHGKKSIDILPLLRFFALDFVGLLAYGRKFDILKEKEGHPVFDLFEDLIGSLAYKSLLPAWGIKLVEMIRIPGVWTKVIVAGRNLCAIAEPIVSETEKEILEAGGVENLPRQTLITRSLTGINSKTGKHIPREEVLGEAAGHLYDLNHASIFVPRLDTSLGRYFLCRCSASYVLWERASRPDIVARLYEELKTVMPAPLDIPSFPQLNALPYLNAVVKEGLRAFGAVATPLERIVPAEGMEIEGHFIPNGATLSTQAWSMHRDDTIFEDGDKFSPGRWLEETKDMKGHFAPFGFGPRLCTGHNLATAELRLILATIVRSFDIKETRHLHPRTCKCRTPFC